MADRSSFLRSMMVNRKIQRSLSCEGRRWRIKILVDLCFAAIADRSKSFDIFTRSFANQNSTIPGILFCGRLPIGIRRSLSADRLPTGNQRSLLAVVCRSESNDPFFTVIGGSESNDLFVMTAVGRSEANDPILRSLIDRNSTIPS